MDSNKELWDLHDYVSEYLHPLNDIELLILKGHNLIEYCMNQYIEDVVPNPTEFIKMNLTFSQKLGIMKFLTVIDFHFFAHISLFNKIRNNLAHNLNPDLESIDKFILQTSYSYDIVKNEMSKNKIMALKYAIRNTCTQINMGRIGAKTTLSFHAQDKVRAFMEARDAENNKGEITDGSQNSETSK